MSFNLGLEALLDNGEFNVTGDILSYEYLDTVMQFNDAAQECIVMADGIGSLCGAYENLGAICDVLREYGNSAALESLVGGNFREGFSLEAASGAKESLWARFVKILKALWAKIKAAFATLFVSASKMSKALRERARQLQDAEMQPVDVKLPSNKVMEALVTFIKTTFSKQLKELQDVIDQMKSGKIEGLQESAVIKLALERGGEMYDSALKGFLDPEKFEFTKQLAVNELISTATALEAIIAAKAIVDAIAKTIDSLSLSMDDKLASAIGSDAKNLASSNGAEEDQANAVGDLAGKAAKGFGSEEFRKGVMKANQFVTKFLNNVSRKLIGYGSLCLSTFKVAKVAKSADNSSSTANEAPKKEEEAKPAAEEQK